MERTNKLIAMACLIALAAACTRQPAEKASALMAHEDEIARLIDQMTLEEKVNMLHGKHMFSSAGVERLGIADMEYADGPFGIREEMEPHSWNSLGLANDSATFFPTGSALAATWSEELAYRYGEGMGKEARLRGKDMILGPAINIQRLPNGGRTYEYLSEDPVLSAALAVKYTLGTQDNGVAVCLKHYALNNQEDYRGTVDVRVSPRAMHEIYLPPFEAAVREADAYGVMAAYNKVEGDWCSENEMLLGRILRQQWGFRGMVISDWGGTHSTVKAVTSGLNVEMPGQRYLGQALLDSVRAGAVDETIVDERVREILRVRLAIKPIPAGEANLRMTSQPEQQRIAYDVAVNAIVLLKNDAGLLPIDKANVKRVAVIGDNAVRPQSLGGVGAGVKALYEVTPLEGITDRLQGSGIDIKWAQGYPYYTKRDRETRVSPYTNTPDPALMAEAVELARASDLVIFVGGDNREVETEGSDRPSIALPLGQDELLRELALANPNLVTVFVTGGPLDLRAAQQVSRAMLISWFNGSEGGHALGDVLTGAATPSGKLPFSFPLKLEDVPAYSLGVYPQQNPRKQDDVFVNLVGNRREAAPSDGPVADYAEDLLVGYRWYDTRQVPVLYPFGHGLSYTTFGYSDLRAKADGKGLDIEFCLANTGSREGEEVVQLYVARPDSKLVRPLKELKGFRRVALQPGEKKSVRLRVPLERLRHWDEFAEDWAVEPGEAEVLIGSSSQDIRLTQKITITMD
ncbi:MAG: glycoside hydrolase family 3 C-terminal domain-containing protein [Mediterranea sp.]|jgi:beta-glucosidase|nr:glycoside hydrolase family 3 C-terminal domain-containing protein [Mediterranea sp.]